MADPETTTSFGYWVRRRRLALDLTQAGLARAVNAATVTISKIEQDERRPSRQMALLLAERLVIPGDERARFLAVALGEVAVDRLPLDGAPLAAPVLPDAPPSNLPVPATPFVGRAAELEQLMARLADPACRLLTLLGAGGFGKTRLAIRLGELALAQPEWFPDGVFFVAFDGLEGGAFVVPAVATAVGFTFYAQERQEIQLLRYLAGKRLLLILDNAEGILDPGFAAQVLAHAPDLTLVVTTREALNLQPEWLHPIGGMEVTVHNAGEHPEHQHADAVALFQQCAQRAQPGFDLARELPHVQRICRLVDGAPLAIELAAAWLKALPCEQVAGELANSLDLLATALRDVPARHRSMRAVLEQSWQQLTEDEQRVFCRLALFEGGFRLEAAQAVVDAPRRVLAALVEKAMLHLAPDGRYRIHALLRQLGAARLATAPAEMADCRTRHAAYFMAFLAERRTALSGSEQMEALREIQAEMDNIRVAWTHLATECQLLPQREALHALFRFLWMRGRYAEGEQLARQALASIDAATPDAEAQAVRIALVAYAAQFANATGVYEAALAEVQAALAEAERIGSLPDQAHCHFAMGLIRSNLTYITARVEAVECLRHALELFRQLHDLAATAETAQVLAYVLATLRAESATCLRLLEEALDISTRSGDISAQAEALNQLGQINWLAGVVDRAEWAYRRSLETAVAAENRLVAAQAIGGLSLVAWVRAEWDQAIALMSQRLEATQLLGHEPQVETSLFLLCALYAHADRYSDAVTLMHAHPNLWHTAWLAQAQVGAGMFVEAMSYLPKLTEDGLHVPNILGDTSQNLVAWAMLLSSDCTLVAGQGSPDERSLPAGECYALAAEILSAVQAFGPTDPATRAQAGRLVARLRDRTGIVPSTPVRSVHELAQTVLTIRLG